MKTVIFPLVCLLVFSQSRAIAEQLADNSSSDNYVFDKQTPVDLLNNFLKEVGPESARGKTLPPLVREHIRWLYSKYQKGEVSIILYGGFFGESKDVQQGPRSSTLMRCSLMETEKGKKPYIEISAHRLLVLFLVQYQEDPRSLSDMAVNMFAITLAHEVEHIRNMWLVDPKRNHDEEELRCWKVTCEQMIRPLVAQGRPLDDEFIIGDSILANCKGNQKCDEFRQFVLQRATLR